MYAFLPSPKLAQIFDAILIQSNRPSLYNFPTVISIRPIVSSSPLPSRNRDDDHCSPCHKPIISPNSFEVAYSSKSPNSIYNVGPSFLLEKHTQSLKIILKTSTKRQGRKEIHSKNEATVETNVERVTEGGQSKSTKTKTTQKTTKLSTFPVCTSYGVVLLDYTHNHQTTPAEAHLLLR